MVEVLNQNYMQRYCKILKRWKFKTKSIGRNIAKLSRGGIYKPSVQAEIPQKFSKGGIYKASVQAEVL